MTLTTDQEESCRYNPDANATEPGRAPIRTRPVPIFLISLLTVVGLVGSWAAATSAELVSPVFLPSPAVVAVSLWNLVSVGFVDSTLLEHVLASLGRVLGGLAVSVVIGVPPGLRSAQVASAGASLTRSSNFCGRCRLWPICP